jgi:hypothetical protein
MIYKEPLNITIPALKKPTLKEIQKDYPFIKKIEKDTSPTRAISVALTTLLEGDEDYINGEEYTNRRKPHEKVLLGYQHLKWLLEDQEKFPSLKALVGKIYIDCPGIIAVNGDGDRVFPCAGGDGSRFGVGWRWTGGRLDRRGRLLVSRASSPSDSSALGSIPLVPLVLETGGKRYEIQAKELS